MTRHAEGVQRLAFHDDQEQRWKLYDEGKLPPGRFVTTGLEYDIGETDKGNPLQGVAHLELMTAKRGTLPLPYVLETDAGNTLELASPPYLLPTAQEGKPFPAGNAVREAIAADNKAIATAFGKSGRGTIYKVSKGLAEQLGVKWVPKAVNLEASNLSLRSNVIEARENASMHNKQHDLLPKQPAEAKLEGAVGKQEEGEAKAVAPGGLFGIGVTETPGDYQKPQINVLTDWAHLAQIEQPTSRLVGKTDQSQYRAVFEQMRAYANKDLTWLRGPLAKQARLAAAADRIEQTVVAHTLEPMRAKFVEYQETLAKGDELDKTKKLAFAAFANLLSYIKDYTNVWLKTDLVTYLLGSLRAEERAILSRALEPRVAGGYRPGLEEWTVEDLLPTSRDKDLTLAVTWLLRNAGTYAAAAGEVLTKTYQALSAKATETGAPKAVVVLAVTREPGEGAATGEPGRQGPGSQPGIIVANAEKKGGGLELEPEAKEGALGNGPQPLLPPSEGKSSGVAVDNGPTQAGPELKGPDVAVANGPPAFTRPGLFGRDPSALGIRHDTFIEQKALDKLAAKLGFPPDTALHVVEIRSKGLDTIDEGQGWTRSTSEAVSHSGSCSGPAPVRQPPASLGPAVRLLLSLTRASGRRAAMYRTPTAGTGLCGWGPRLPWRAGEAQAGGW